jgi:hypothetical protein
MALLAALLAAVGVVAPVVSAPSRWVVGTAHVDAYGTLWFQWFTRRVLSGQEDPRHSALLFHPWGKDVWLHTGGNLVDAVIAAPLGALLGPVLGANLLVLLVLVTNGVGTARLADALGAPARWRWSASLAGVLNPYALLELQQGRPTQALLGFALLSLASLLRLRDARDAVLGGVWLALAGWTYWFHGLALGVCAVVGGAVRLARRSDSAADAGRLLLAALVCGVLVAPAAVAMLGAVGSGQVPGLLALDGAGPLAPLALRTVEGDPEGVWVVAPGRAFEAGALIDEGGLRFVPGGTVAVAAQVVFGAVGILAAWRAQRGRAVVVLACLGAAVWLACGPAWIVGERVSPSSLYLWALESLPFLRRWWWPGRAIAIAQAVLCALVPLAVGALAERRGGLAVASACGGLWIAQLGWVGQVPLGRWDASGSRVLECLATAPEGAVVDIPGEADQKHLFLQVLHGRPVLSGMLSSKASFAPPDVARLRAGNPLVRALDDIGARRWTRVPDVPAAARDELRGLGYRYVLARADGFQRPGADGGWESEWSRPRRLLEQLLGAAPFAEDARFAVWDLEGAAQECR